MRDGGGLVCVGWLAVVVKQTHWSIHPTHSARMEGISIVSSLFGILFGGSNIIQKNFDTAFQNTSISNGHLLYIIRLNLSVLWTLGRSRSSRLKEGIHKDTTPLTFILIQEHLEKTENFFKTRYSPFQSYHNQWVTEIFLQYEISLKKVVYCRNYRSTDGQLDMTKL